MAEGTYKFRADGPEHHDSGDRRFAIQAIAWGATELGDHPAKHTYGIRFELRQSSEPEGEFTAAFSIPLATARELGIWLVEKVDALSI